MKYKRYIFPVLMGFTMSNIMSMVNTGRILFPDILKMMLLQAAVASAASLVFPAGMIGARLTKKYFPKLRKAGFLFVSSVLPAVFFTAVMSLSGMLVMKGYSEGFWKMYFSSFPLFLLYGYCVSIILNVIIDKLLSLLTRN